MKRLLINLLALAFISHVILSQDISASEQSAPESRKLLPWQGELSFWHDSELIEFAELEHTASWQPSRDGWIRSTFMDADYWLGSERARVWLKIDFSKSNLPDKPTWLELSSLTVNNALLFFKTDGGRYQQAIDNATKSSFGHDLPTRRLSLEIRPEWRKYPVYVAVEAPFSVLVKVNHWQQEAFLVKTYRDNFFFAFCYGLLSIMVLYNVVIGRYLREKIYYYYSVAIGASIVYQFLVHGHLRLLFQIDWGLITVFLPLLALTAIIALIIFLNAFLDLKRYLPQFSKYLIWYLYALGATAVLVTVLPTHVSYKLSLMVIMPAPLAIFGAALMALKKGCPTAKVFLIAWSFYIIGGTLWIGYWLGLLPMTPLIERTFMAGIATESVLLSFALGYRIQLLEMEKNQLIADQSVLKQLSFVDALSQVGNRRAFDTQLNKWAEQNKTFGLALLDIDHFKKFNDTWGHADGDNVIASLGLILKQNVPQPHLVARIGGEEFAILFDGDSAGNLEQIVSEIHLAFGAIPFNVSKGNTVHCSLSAGYGLRHKNESSVALFKRVDEALYQAKKEGRNQYFFSPPNQMQKVENS